jgi:GNAT superfamily N-acetyltransferase
LRAKITYFYEIKEENNKVEIDDFFVSEEYQNKGMAKKALNHCIDIIKKKNIPMAYSYVFSKDSRQIELYAKCGFSIMELIGDTRCVMSKKIDLDE